MLVQEKRRDVPFIENLNLVRRKGIEDAQDVYEHHLPHAQLELMHQIALEQRVEVQAELPHEDRKRALCIIAQWHTIIQAIFRRT